MKEIKDYLHLYLGCEVYRQGTSNQKLDFYILAYIKEFNIWKEIKPILRPPHTDAEGLVWRCIEDNLSFKVINNKYLLKEQ